jgi:O-antigen/teichoic acid export membrane protein
MNLLVHIASPSGIVVVESILLALINLATYSILLRVCDMETVGLWVLVSSLLAFSRVADFWSRGLSSFVAEALGRGEQMDAAGFVSTAAVSGAAGYLVLSGVGTVAVYLLVGAIAGAEHAGSVREVLPLMAVTFWLTSLAGIYQLAFLGFGRPLLKTVQVLGGALLFLLGAILLAPEHGLAGILLAQALQAAAMLAFALVAFHGFIAPKGAALWQRERLVSLAVFGSKAIVVGAFQLAIEPVIRTLVSYFGGLAAVAVVDLASRLIMFVRGVIVSLGQILVPAFARLSANGAENAALLFRDTNRLFLLASIPAFSLMLSAGPALEQILFGRPERHFLPFIWILSLAWIANTLASSAHFLLHGRRQLRPLLWSHLIMTVGAIALGSLGGLVAGVYGSLGGVAAAFVTAALYLVRKAEQIVGRSAGFRGDAQHEPKTLLPLVVAGFAALAIHLSGLQFADATVRIFAYVIAIAATLGACLVSVRTRDILMLAERIRP